MKANIYDVLRNQEKPGKKIKKEEKKESVKETKKKKIKIKEKTEEKKDIKKNVKKNIKKDIKKEVKKEEPKPDYEKRLDNVNKKREKKRTALQAMKEMSTKQKRKLIIFSILIAYGIFLIYGVANSDFIINEDGLTMPVAKSQEDVKDMKEYKLIKSYYTDAQNKYKEILNTDIALAQNPNSQKVIATRYEGYISFFDNFITQLNGVEISEKYAYVKEGLISWATNDIGPYLLNIGNGISMNNEESKTKALEDRLRCINDFNIITENMVSVSSTIKGADVNGLDFNPEKYYVQQMGGE